jgi:hypothetical protein
MVDPVQGAAQPGDPGVKLAACSVSSSCPMPEQ